MPDSPTDDYADRLAQVRAAHAAMPLSDGELEHFEELAYLRDPRSLAAKEVNFGSVVPRLIAEVREWRKRHPAERWDG